MSADYRQQQELQEQQEAEIMSALREVKEKCGDGTALVLASNLGMSDQYRQHTQKGKRYEMGR